MKITITGRHVELTSSLKKYAEKKLSKIENYFDFKESGELHIIITVEKYRHIAEATLKSKDHNFTAKVETKDMYSSIDMLEDKLVNQIKKYKDKLVKSEKSKKRGMKNFRNNISNNISEIENIKGEIFNSVIEEDLQAVKPLSTEEAIEEVNLMNEKTLLFYNVDFNKICLIRKRKDNTYGLTISKY